MNGKIVSFNFLFENSLSLSNIIIQINDSRYYSRIIKRINKIELKKNSYIFFRYKGKELIFIRVLKLKIKEVIDHNQHLQGGDGEEVKDSETKLIIQRFNQTR